MNLRTLLIGGVTIASFALTACGGGGSNNDSSTPINLNGMAWNVYDASVLPDAANSVKLAAGGSSQFSFCNSVNCKNTYSSVSNGTLTIDSQTDMSDETWYGFQNAFAASSYPKYATAIFRTRAPVITSGTYGLMVMLNLGDPGAVSGPAVQLFVRAETDTNGGLVIFNTDTTPSSATPSTYSNTLSTSQWHTYQMTVAMANPTTGTLNVYMDGASTPVISKTVTNIAQVYSAGDSSLRIGEGATNAYGKMDLDWIIWTNTGAYTPAELVGKLPASLGTVAGY